MPGSNAIDLVMVAEGVRYVGNRKNETTQAGYSIVFIIEPCISRRRLLHAPFFLMPCDAPFQARVVGSWRRGCAEFTDDPVYSDAWLPDQARIHPHSLYSQHPSFILCSNSFNNWTIHFNCASSRSRPGLQRSSNGYAYSKGLWQLMARHYYSNSGRGSPRILIQRSGLQS